MKRIIGMALLALPLLAASARAEGWPFNVQAGGSFYLKGGPGWASPQAGPWYLYWPLEAHFVAPAPTGYPYWPSPQGLPGMSFGGPSCPPPALGVPPPVVTAPPIATAPAAAQPTPPATRPASPQLQLPPYLQPTNYYPAAYTTQPPSYWYDR